MDRELELLVLAVEDTPWYKGFGPHNSDYDFACFHDVYEPFCEEWHIKEGIRQCNRGGNRPIDHDHDDDDPDVGGPTTYQGDQVDEIAAAKREFQKLREQQAAERLEQEDARRREEEQALERERAQATSTATRRSRSRPAVQVSESDDSESDTESDNTDYDHINERRRREDVWGEEDDPDSGDALAADDEFVARPISGLPDGTVPEIGGEAYGELFQLLTGVKSTGDPEQDRLLWLKLRLSSRDKTDQGAVVDGVPTKGVEGQAQDVLDTVLGVPKDLSDFRRIDRPIGPHIDEPGDLIGAPAWGVRPLDGQVDPTMGKPVTGGLGDLDDFRGDLGDLGNLRDQLIRDKGENPYADDAVAAREILSDDHQAILDQHADLEDWQRDRLLRDVSRMDEAERDKLLQAVSDGRLTGGYRDIQSVLGGPYIDDPSSLIGGGDYLPGSWKVRPGLPDDGDGGVWGFTTRPIDRPGAEPIDHPGVEPIDVAIIDDPTPTEPSSRPASPPVDADPTDGTDTPDSDEPPRPEVGTPEYLQWKAEKQGYDNYDDYFNSQYAEGDPRRTDTYEDWTPAVGTDEYLQWKATKQGYATYEDYLNLDPANANGAEDAERRRAAAADYDLEARLEAIALASLSDEEREELEQLEAYYAQLQDAPVTDQDDQTSLFTGPADEPVYTGDGDNLDADVDIDVIKDRIDQLRGGGLDLVQASDDLDLFDPDDTTDPEDTTLKIMTTPTGDSYIAKYKTVAGPDGEVTFELIGESRVLTADEVANIDRIKGDKPTLVTDPDGSFTPVEGPGGLYTIDDPDDLIPTSIKSPAEQYSERFLELTGQEPTGDIKQDKQLIRNAYKQQEAEREQAAETELLATMTPREQAKYKYDKEFTEFTGTAPTGDPEEDQAKWQETYDKKFKEYTGVEPTGDPEKDNKAWEVAGKRRAQTAQKRYDEAVDKATDVARQFGDDYGAAAVVGSDAYKEYQQYLRYAENAGIDTSNIREYVQGVVSKIEERDELFDGYKEVAESSGGTLRGALRRGGPHWNTAEGQGLRLLSEGRLQLGQTISLQFGDPMPVTQGLIDRVMQGVARREQQGAERVEQYRILHELPDTPEGRAAAYKAVVARVQEWRDNRETVGDKRQDREQKAREQAEREASGRPDETREEEAARIRVETAQKNLANKPNDPDTQDKFHNAVKDYKTTKDQQAYRDQQSYDRLKEKGEQGHLNDGEQAALLRLGGRIAIASQERAKMPEQVLATSGLSDLVAKIETTGSQLNASTSFVVRDEFREDQKRLRNEIDQLSVEDAEAVREYLNDVTNRTDQDWMRANSQYERDAGQIDTDTETPTAHRFLGDRVDELQAKREGDRPPVLFGDTPEESNQQKETILDAIRTQDAASAAKWHGQDPAANLALLKYLGTDTEGLSEEQIAALASRATQVNNVGIRSTQDMEQISSTLIPDRLDGGYLALSTDPNTGEVRTVKIGRNGETVGYTIGAGRYDVGRQRYDDWAVFYDHDTDSLRRADNVETDEEFTTVTRTEFGLPVPPTPESDTPPAAGEADPLFGGGVDAPESFPTNVESQPTVDPSDQLDALEERGYDTDSMSDEEVAAEYDRLMGTTTPSVDVSSAPDEHPLLSGGEGFRLDEEEVPALDAESGAGTTADVPGEQTERDRILATIATQDTSNADRWHGRDQEANRRLLDHLGVDTEGMTDEEINELGSRATQVNNQGIRPTPNMDQISQTLIPDRLDGGYLALSTDPRTGQIQTVKIGRDGETAGYTLGADRYDTGKERYDTWDAYYDWETDSLKQAANVESDQGFTTVTETEVDQLGPPPTLPTQDELFATNTRPANLPDHDYEGTLIPDRLDGGYLAIDRDPNTGEVRTVKISRDGTIGYNLGTERYDEGKERYDTQEVYYDWKTDSMKRAANIDSEGEFQTVPTEEIPWHESLVQPTLETDAALTGEGITEDNPIGDGPAVSDGATSLANDFRQAVLAEPDPELDARWEGVTMSDGTLATDALAAQRKWARHYEETTGEKPTLDPDVDNPTYYQALAGNVTQPDGTPVLSETELRGISNETEYWGALGSKLLGDDSIKSYEDYQQVSGQQTTSAFYGGGNGQVGMTAMLDYLGQRGYEDGDLTDQEVVAEYNRLTKAQGVTDREAAWKANLQEAMDNPSMSPGEMRARFGDRAGEIEAHVDQARQYNNWFAQETGQMPTGNAERDDLLLGEAAVRREEEIESVVGTNRVSHYGLPDGTTTVNKELAEDAWIAKNGVAPDFQQGGADPNVDPDEAISALESHGYDVDNMSTQEATDTYRRLVNSRTVSTYQGDGPLSGLRVNSSEANRIIAEAQAEESQRRGAELLARHAAPDIQAASDMARGFEQTGDLQFNRYVPELDTHSPEANSIREKANKKLADAVSAYEFELERQRDIDNQEYQLNDNETATVNAAKAKLEEAEGNLSKVKQHHQQGDGWRGGRGWTWDALQDIRAAEQTVEDLHSEIDAVHATAEKDGRRKLGWQQDSTLPHERPSAIAAQKLIDDAVEEVYSAHVSTNWRDEDGKNFKEKWDEVNNSGNLSYLADKFEGAVDTDSYLGASTVGGVQMIAKFADKTPQGQIGPVNLADVGSAGSILTGGIGDYFALKGKATDQGIPGNWATTSEELERVTGAGRVALAFGATLPLTLTGVGLGARGLGVVGGKVTAKAGTKFLTPSVYGRPNPFVTNIGQRTLPDIVGPRVQFLKSGINPATGQQFGNQALTNQLANRLQFMKSGINPTTGVQYGNQAAMPLLRGAGRGGAYVGKEGADITVGAVGEGLVESWATGHMDIPGEFVQEVALRPLEKVAPFGGSIQQAQLSSNLRDFAVAARDAPGRVPAILKDDFTIIDAYGNIEPTYDTAPAAPTAKAQMEFVPTGGVNPVTGKPAGVWRPKQTSTQASTDVPGYVPFQAGDRPDRLGPLFSGNLYQGKALPVPIGGLNASTHESGAGTTLRGGAQGRVVIASGALVGGLGGASGVPDITHQEFVDQMPSQQVEFEQSSMTEASANPTPTPEPAPASTPEAAPTPASSIFASFDDSDHDSDADNTREEQDEEAREAEERLHSQFAADAEHQNEESEQIRSWLSIAEQTAAEQQEAAEQEEVADEASIPSRTQVVAAAETPSRAEVPAPSLATAVSEAMTNQETPSESEVPAEAEVPAPSPAFANVEVNIPVDVPVTADIPDYLPALADFPDHIPVTIEEETPVVGPTRAPVTVAETAAETAAEKRRRARLFNLELGTKHEEPIVTGEGSPSKARYLVLAEVERDLHSGEESSTLLDRSRLHIKQALGVPPLEAVHEGRNVQVEVTPTGRVKAKDVLYRSTKRPKAKANKGRGGHDFKMMRGRGG